MPNHCANQLTVKGPADQVAAFREQGKGDKEALDLNGFIPMPEEFRNAIEPVRDEEEQAALIEKHGAADCYTWTALNWGTKWNCYDVEIREDGEKVVTYWFYTAWGPFDQHVLAKMSEEYPDLLLTLVFAERLMDFWGEWDAMRGEIVGESGGEDIDSVSSSGVYDVAAKSAAIIHQLAEISG